MNMKYNYAIQKYALWMVTSIKLKGKQNAVDILHLKVVTWPVDTKQMTAIYRQ